MSIAHTAVRLGYSLSDSQGFRDVLISNLSLLLLFSRLEALTSFL